MIAYLSGKILQVLDDSLILENQGIGYQIFVSENWLLSVNCGDDLELYIHHHIREDNQTLYGFKSIEDRLLFKKFLSVNGIGPKSAIAVLSAGPRKELIRAIQFEDHAVFQAVSGIGHKTAKRLVLELKNKVEWDDSSEAGEPSTNSTRSDLLQALEQLGYSTSEIQKIVSDIDLADLTLEDAIKKVLVYLRS